MSPMRRNWIAAVVLMLLLAIAGAYLLGYNRKTVSSNISPTPSSALVPSGTGSPSAMPSSTAATQHEVTFTSSGFTPATITIKAGDTVVWINQSGAPATVNSDPHPTHTDYPPLNLGTFGNGATLSLTFPKAGTYGYHNHLNPVQKGTVIVK